jgi:hypothetical protein
LSSRANSVRDRTIWRTWWRGPRSLRLHWANWAPLIVANDVNLFHYFVNAKGCQALTRRTRASSSGSGIICLGRRRASTTGSEGMRGRGPLGHLLPAEFWH